MPDNKNIMDIALEMTENLDIFTHKNKKVKTLEIGDFIIQTVDNPHIINMWVHGQTNPKPLPKNYLVVRDKTEVSKGLKYLAMIEFKPLFKKWLRPRFGIYYHGTCQQFMNISNLRIAISEYMQSYYK